MSDASFEIEAIKTENFEQGMTSLNRNTANQFANFGMKFALPILRKHKTAGELNELFGQCCGDFGRRVSALVSKPVSAERYCAVCDEIKNLFRNAKETHDQAYLFAKGLPDAFTMLSVSPSADDGSVVDAASARRCISHLREMCKCWAELFESQGITRATLANIIPGDVSPNEDFKLRADGNYDFNGNWYLEFAELLLYFQRSMCDWLSILPTGLDMSQAVTKEGIFHYVAHMMRVSDMRWDNVMSALQESDMMAARKGLIAIRAAYRTAWASLQQSEQEANEQLLSATSEADKVIHVGKLSVISNYKKLLEFFARRARLSVDYILSEKEIVVRATKDLPARCEERDDGDGSRGSAGKRDLHTAVVAESRRPSSFIGKDREKSKRPPRQDRRKSSKIRFVPFKLQNGSLEISKAGVIEWCLPGKHRKKQCIITAPRPVKWLNQLFAKYASQTICNGDKLPCIKLTAAGWNELTHSPRREGDGKEFFTEVVMKGRKQKGKLNPDKPCEYPIFINPALLPLGNLR